MNRFKNRFTEQLAHGMDVRSVPPEIQSRAEEKLNRVLAAEDLRDLARVRGDRLEQLRGNWAGQWSVRINQRWPVCFRWDGRVGAYDVEVVDYH